MKHLLFAALAMGSFGILLGGCSPDGATDMVNEKQEWKPLDLGPQELEMVFVRLIPGTNWLSVRQGHDYIKPEELDLLRKQGVSGELVARGIFRRGEGDKRARVLVVMASNVISAVDLKQPDGTNAVWLQSGETFLMLPTNTPTIAKTLKLERYDHPMDGNTTHYSIDMGSVIQGGTAIIWGQQSESR